MESLSPLPPPSKGKKAESRGEAAAERSDATAVSLADVVWASFATNPGLL